VRQASSIAGGGQIPCSRANSGINSRLTVN
jgi:hypothetical protein